MHDQKLVKFSVTGYTHPREIGDPDQIFATFEAEMTDALVALGWETYFTVTIANREGKNDHIDPYA